STPTPKTTGPNSPTYTSATAPTSPTSPAYDPTANNSSSADSATAAPPTPSASPSTPPPTTDTKTPSSSPDPPPAPPRKPSTPPAPSTSPDHTPNQPQTSTKTRYRTMNPNLSHLDQAGIASTHRHACQVSHRTPRPPTDFHSHPPRSSPPAGTCRCGSSPTSRYRIRAGVGMASYDSGPMRRPRGSQPACLSIMLLRVGTK